MYYCPYVPGFFDVVFQFKHPYFAETVYFLIKGRKKSEIPNGSKEITRQELENLKPLDFNIPEIGIFTLIKDVTVWKKTTLNRENYLTELRLKKGTRVNITTGRIDHSAGAEPTSLLFHKDDMYIQYVCGRVLGKCRAESAEVITHYKIITKIFDHPCASYSYLSYTPVPESTVFSLHDRTFAYTIGTTIVPTVSFATTLDACSTGIHFFFTKVQALVY